MLYIKGMKIACAAVLINRIEDVPAPTRNHQMMVVFFKDVEEVLAGNHFISLLELILKYL